MKKIITIIVSSLVAVLYVQSAPETSLSYNRLNLDFAYLESDADDIDVSSNGASIRLQVSPIQLIYFNIGGSFESAEADDFDIDGDASSGLLGVGTYLPLSYSLHLNFGVDGVYTQGDIDGFDFDSWSVTPYAGLRIEVLTNLEIYGLIGYSSGEIEYDDFDEDEDIDGLEGDIGVIFGLTDNLALNASALFAEDTFGGKLGLQLNF